MPDIATQLAATEKALRDTENEALKYLLACYDAFCAISELKKLVSMNRLNRSKIQSVVDYIYKRLNQIP